MQDFAWFDLVVISLVLILAIKGLLNGFIKELFGIIGLIGGVIVASRYAMSAGEFINNNIYAINSSSWYFFGFLLVLIVFWVVCLILGRVFAKMLSMSGFAFVDRALGFLLGSAKIFLVFAIFSAIIASIPIINDKLTPYAQKSVVYPFLLTSGQFIMNVDYKNLPVLGDTNLSQNSTLNAAKSFKDLKDLNLSDINTNKELNSTRSSYE